jgi:cell wall-associated NlpC family hydrolase
MLFDRKKSEAIAQELLSMKYERDGRGLPAKASAQAGPRGVDCYGVLVYYYKQFGLNLPDYFTQKDWGDNEEIILREYANFFRRLSSLENPETGDMMILRNTEGELGHLALYLGDQRFIHSYEKIGTKIDSLINRAWKKNVYGFFRVKKRTRDTDKDTNG